METKLVESIILKAIYKENVNKITKVVLCRFQTIIRTFCNGNIDEAVKKFFVKIVIGLNRIWMFTKNAEYIREKEQIHLTI